MIAFSSHRPRSDRARRVAAPALIFAAALALLAPASPAPAAQSDSPASVSINSSAVRSLQLGVGRSMIVDLPEDASEIFVGEPKIANAIVRSARRLYISTLSAGQTTIFALGPNGRKIAVLEISVGRDVGELAKLFDTAIPGNDIHIRTVGGSIVLTGSVASAGEAQKALDIANAFVGDAGGAITSGGSGAAGGASAAGGAGGGAGGAGGGGATTSSSGSGGATPTAAAANGNLVVNSLTIRGLDQVSLRVTVSEIRRDIIKQLGVNFSGKGTSNSFSINNPLAVNGAVTNTKADISWSVAGLNLTAELLAYEQQGVARTLAEPTVTAVSGESAKFLAGGTIPIPGGETCQNGTCLLSIVQQPYGVSLSFEPVVLSHGRIQLHIATEVTDIDSSKTLNLYNTAIPGFRTRKNETTVELPSGGSIASAGLITSQTQQAIGGVPGLINLPVLGALFRSRDYLRQETELLIIVTPYIVHAIDPKDVARPDLNMVDASDPQAWILGRVNRLYSSTGGATPAPAYSGKVGFITY